VANRTAERPEGRDTPVPFTRAAIEDAASNAVLVVNATSLGMGSEEVPPELPLDALDHGSVAYDLVYRSEPTPWLRAAADRGARVVDGQGMLLHQGAAAFRQWTGVEPPLDAMRRGLTGRT
jgi:shikimate dehydrogenase